MYFNQTEYSEFGCFFPELLLQLHEKDVNIIHLINTLERTVCFICGFCVGFKGPGRLFWFFVGFFFLHLLKLA